MTIGFAATPFTVLGVLLLSAGIGAGAQGRVPSQVEQQAIARQMLFGAVGERRAAVQAAAAIAPADTTPPLRAALIALVERHNGLVEQARRAGTSVSAVEDPEFITYVERLVAGLRDPAAIPALAGALGRVTAIQALAAFGERAAPAVLDVLRDRARDHYAVNDALIAARFMVERRDTHALSARTLAGLRDAAHARLAAPRQVTTLWYAMDLAAVLADSELRSILEMLAANPGDSVARGVADPALVTRTQQRASERLAGVPALPRPGY